jgi:hypothetical protein
MIKHFFITLLFLSFLTTGFAQSKVYLIPTLHGLHKTNSQYTYGSLQAIIGKIKPDVIAVEMRAEDVASDTSYLKKNYPYEMWMAGYWFASSVIEGFDWLGNDLEGKPIPGRYWKDQSRIKALERLLDGDSLYSTRLSRCQTYVDERMNILKNNSLKNILRSSDAILTKVYYDCMNLQLQGSDYAELTNFYAERNKKMQERLSAIIKKYPGKTIVVLTGDDHYPYLMEYLRKQNVVLAKPY